MSRTSGDDGRKDYGARDRYTLWNICSIEANSSAATHSIEQLATRRAKNSSGQWTFAIGLGRDVKVNGIQATVYATCKGVEVAN
jgi:hypothetical protein